MASRVPWPRIAIFTVILAVLAWWLYMRDRGMGGEEAPPPERPGSVVGGPVAEGGVAVVDILAYDVKEGETPAYWIRVGKRLAWDVELPGPAKTEKEREHAEKQLATALDELKDELELLRREEDEAGHGELKGEIRRTKGVPAMLYTRVFQAFRDAGYRQVTVDLTDGKPPGPLHGR